MEEEEACLAFLSMSAESPVIQYTRCVYESPPAAQSKLSFPKFSTVDPSSLVIMLIDPEIWKPLGHYPARGSAFNDGVFGEVLNAEVFAEEVFVEFELSVDG